MKSFTFAAIYALSVASTAFGPALATPPAPAKLYVFGTSTKVETGAIRVNGVYSADRGFGFDGDLPTPEDKSVSGKPFFFSVDVPEGNYKLTVTLGGDQASETTVKAELRRLMLERIRVPAGGSVEQTIVVNVRTPTFPGGKVALKVPREVITEARAWDARLTLEFNGNPAVRSILVEPVNVPTIYLLGDSTVADQSGEPYASWGQMLPRFFRASIAVANHSESGESTFSSKTARRFDKIFSLLKPGDYVLVQFGHNDQKSNDPDKEDKYKANLVEWAAAIKSRGAVPVILTPMNRNRFEGGRVVETLGAFPDMARLAATESGALLIDLHSASRILYESLGPQKTNALFMHSPDYSKKDATHHSPYGAYELAKIVIQGLRDGDRGIRAHLLPGLPAYNPAQPMPEADFKVPASITFTNERPLGVNQE